MSSIDSLKQKIAHETSQVLGVDVQPEWVEFSNPKAGSHLALPCFRMAGQLGSSPQEIAERAVLTLKIEGFSKIEAQGPYLNFWVEAGELASRLKESMDSQLANKPSNNETAIVEFLSPNLAKPLSVGHLRNVLQGRALLRMYQNEGYNVVTDDHIGDWGTVFGMWVVGFEQFSSDEKLEKGGVEELGRMYVEMRKALKEEEDSEETPLADAVQDWLLKLEANDPEAWKYHTKFKDISLGDIIEQMKQFDIEFDHHYGESFYIERGKQMVGELVESGDAVRNEDGSVVVPIEEQGVDVPMLIEKSNGASLYHTSDIATIEFREKEWNPSIVLYVVGAEQQFHFQQLFAANQKVGWSDAELVHHWYGLVEELGDDGKRQKMSSRKSAIFMTDLIERAKDRARSAASEEMSDEDVAAIGLGALTFQEFSASHTGSVLFDWDSMFSLSGFSGPYVQYAAVRINSVLEKAETTPVMSPDFDWSPHADLLWQLSKYPVVIEEAMEDHEFHKLAEFAYDLARAWNKFYEDNQIIGSDDEASLLWLAQTIGKYLDRSLYLLGIKIPSKM